PYSAYDIYPARIVLDNRGDLEARFFVRITELFESYRLILDILERLPEGDLTTRIPRRIKAGESISRVEAPRGELFYFIKSNGSDTPERIRARTPTVCNMMSVVKLLVGHQLADVPMILAGIDPCFSCNDRMVVLNRGRNMEQLLTWEALRQYGIDYYQRHSA
ncbi:MAG: NADH dehydrogenase subunit, partial [Anaerolineales bacterium]